MMPEMMPFPFDVNELVSKVVGNFVSQAKFSVEPNAMGVLMVTGKSQEQDLLEGLRLQKFTTTNIEEALYQLLGEAREIAIQRGEPTVTTDIVSKAMATYCPWPWC